jgi:hypothetical protein
MKARLCNHIRMFRHWQSLLEGQLSFREINMLTEMKQTEKARLALLILSHFRKTGGDTRVQCQSFLTAGI